MANWKGTLVPNSGTVEKVYVNINLTIDEVKNILKNLNYISDGGGEDVYYILCPENSGNSFNILANKDKTEFIIQNGIGDSTMFIFSTTSNVGFVGWNTEFDGIINVNSTVSNIINSNNDPVGVENDKLTSLFSITLFTRGEETTADKLQKLIDNKQLIVDSVNAKAGTSYDIHSKPSDIANTIDNIQSGGGEDMLQARVDSNNSCAYLFYNYGGTNVDFISNLDTSNVTNMINMFQYCSNLTSIPQLDTSKVTNMYYMFYGCSALTSVPQLNTSKVTNMQYMFYNCKALTSVPQLDTSSVPNIQGIFSGCTNLTSIPPLDTSKITTMQYMFSNCTSLTTIPQLDTSSVTNMGYMFSSCSSLTSIPQLDTSSVTNMANMFSSCSKLTSVPQLDTSKVTTIGNMFSSCSSLTSIQLDTSKVTNMYNTFFSCLKLETIDITYYHITSSGDVSGFAMSCTALKSLIIRSFGTSYALNTSSLQNSGIAKGIGYIYVPRSMVDTLKSATNWSTYASQIRALEDYTVDGTTTGALDETKI